MPTVPASWARVQGGGNVGGTPTPANSNANSNWAGKAGLTVGLTLTCARLGGAVVPIGVRGLGEFAVCPLDLVGLGAPGNAQLAV